MSSSIVSNMSSCEDIEKVFKLFDCDNTNLISFRNLVKVAQELGESIDDEELQDIIDLADKDGNGEINLDEFYLILSHCQDRAFLENLPSDDAKLEGFRLMRMLTKFTLLSRRFGIAVACALKYGWSASRCLELSGSMEAAADEQGGSKKEQGKAALEFVAQTIKAEKVAEIRAQHKREKEAEIRAQH